MTVHPQSRNSPNVKNPMTPVDTVQRVGSLDNPEDMSPWETTCSRKYTHKNHRIPFNFLKVMSQGRTWSLKVVSRTSLSRSNKRRCPASETDWAVVLSRVSVTTLSQLMWPSWTSAVIGHVFVQTYCIWLRELFQGCISPWWSVDAANF